VAMTQTLAAAVKVPVIASGGVGTVEHIRDVAAAGNIAGVIVGRSLYEGTLTVSQAIAAVSLGPNTTPP